uniref:Neuregulin 2b n=1 Tax=Echeneis naucrates TaxID=173247 RepID=A0A665X2W3_ECHNA
HLNPHSQSLTEGDKLYLKCEATGSPSPSFRWYKDGHELQKGRDLKIKTNKKNSKVQISRVRVEDSGNYTCVAENSLGQENATSIISVQILTTTTPSPGVSHARRCNDSEKAHCVNGGDCYFIHGINQLSCKCPNDYTGDRCQNSVMAGFYKLLRIEFMGMEHYYSFCCMGPSITICQMIFVTFCRLTHFPDHVLFLHCHLSSRKQRKKMQNHLHQNQNQCVDQPTRILSNGPNHPGPGHEEIPMVDYIPTSVPTTECVISHGAEGAGNYAGSRMSTRSHHSTTASHASRYVSALTTPARLSPVEFHYPALPPQVPTFQITSPNTSHALSLPPAAAAYHRDDDQPLLRCPDVPHSGLYRQPRRPRRPYLTESTGSLPSSPYRLPDDEAYETTQEYASSREPIRSRRRPRRNRLNGHISQRSAGLRDYSSQSFSQSEEEEEEEEEEEDAQGESTPFLSMQNMNVDPPLSVPGFRSSSGADTRTHRGLSRPGTRSNGQSRGSQPQRSKADNMPL